MCSQGDQAMHGTGEVLYSRSCRTWDVLVVRHCTGCGGRGPKACICPLRCPVGATLEEVVEQMGALQDGMKESFMPAGGGRVVLNNSTGTTGW